MSRLVLCAIVIAAVVIALHSASISLVLAALCGACGVVSLALGPSQA